MKKKVFFIAAFLLNFVLAAFLYAVPLEWLVSADTALQLRSNDELIVVTQLRNPSPVMPPADSNLRQLIADEISSLNPNILIETMYLYRKPAVSNENSGGWSASQRAGLFNQMLALSTLTGIQYYSASRGEMRTFFEYSSVIAGPNSRNTLPDPVYDIPPAELTVYARQRDLTFGDNIYQYAYTAYNNAFFFVQENVTSLSIGLIPVIGRGNLRSIVAVFDCEDSLLIYTASIARAATLLGMGERVGTSLGNRAEAVLKWLTGRADMVFLAQ